MGYVESNLGKDEVILARATHSKAALFRAVVVSGLTILIIILTNLLFEAMERVNGGADSVSITYEVLFTVLRVILWVCGIIVAVWLIVDTAVSVKCNQLVVTNKRLLGRKGVISKNVVDILLLKLDNIRVENGVFGALLHYGTIEVVSAGSQQIINGRSVNLKFPYIKNTEEFKRAVLAAIDKAKEEEREAQAEAQAEAFRRAQEKYRP